MAFLKDDAVGIIPVHDTGLVHVVHVDAHCDVKRDSTLTVEKYADAALLTLPPGRTVRHRDYREVGPDRGLLFVAHYTNRKGKRSVRVFAHRVVNGHVMGRMSL